MSYKRANDILPEHLLRIIQNYIDGEYIYIPRKEFNKKLWGEKKNSRNNLSDRNFEVFQKYQKGASVKELAAAYYLSPKTIYKIISTLK